MPELPARGRSERIDATTHRTADFTPQGETTRSSLSISFRFELVFVIADPGSSFLRNVLGRVKRHLKSCAAGPARGARAFPGTHRVQFKGSPGRESKSFHPVPARLDSITAFLPRGAPVSWDDESNQDRVFRNSPDVHGSFRAGRIRPEKRVDGGRPPGDRCLGGSLHRFLPVCVRKLAQDL